MNPTALLYFTDFTLLECEATVVGVVQERGKQAIILDETVLYPQGGGQPADAGMIESDHALFRVEDVRFQEGIVRHYGVFEKGMLREGDAVHCRVDAVRRLLHSRIHSGGHLIDMAVDRLKLPWVPGKGYHFPQGPYVEYEGTLESVDRDKLKNQIEEQCRLILSENPPVRLVFVEKEQMHTVCRFVPEYLPPGKPGRVVMFGDFGVPCGGTHVAMIGEIGGVEVRKIKQEGPHIRLSYSILKH